MNVVFYFYSFFLFWGLFSLGLLTQIRMNFYKRYMKEKNGREQLAEIKRWEAIYLIQPTVYEITVEYVEEGEKKERLIKTSSSFAKKYKKEKVIPIVTVPGTNFLFAKEEDWRKQNLSNICLMFAIALMFVITTFGFVKGLPTGMAYFISFLYFALLFLEVWLGKKPQTHNWHKTRMKYVTKLSYEEVIDRLRQGTDGKIVLEKEKEDRKDAFYLLSVNSKAPFYVGGMCEKVRYKILVTFAREGSAVWVYLIKCHNPYMLNCYAKRLKEFLEKRIEAARVE